METFDYEAARDPQRLSEQAHQSFAAQAHPAEHGEDHSTSVREVTYKGRRIRIETTYRITVDDEAVTGHVMVNNEGRVHYHSIPNQEFESAVDMVKRVIDLMPPTGADSAQAGDRY
jgi:hypothetical protein